MNIDPAKSNAMDSLPALKKLRPGSRSRGKPVRLASSNTPNETIADARNFNTILNHLTQVIFETDL